MSDERPSPRLLAPAGALARGAFLVALLAAGPEARAQDASTSREPSSAGAAPQTPAAIASRGGGAGEVASSLGLRGATAPGSRAGRPAPNRRTRPPTQGAVRGIVRGPLVPSRFAPVVRPALTGLPDPTVTATARRRRKPPELDPYAPLGLRSGGVTFFPAIEQSLGYDTNPNRVENPRGKGSLVGRTEGELKLQSDWPVHALVGSLRGSYTTYPNVEGADRPEGAGNLALRLDASRDLSFDVEGRFLIDTQRPGSPDLNATVRDRPIIAQGGASLGATQRFNRLALSLKGSVDRTVYEDARLTDGTLLDQGDRDQNQFGVKLRAAYEVTPGLSPFVEGLADARVYDREIDRAGYQRSSQGVGAKVGTTFELTRLLTGEVAGGVQVRRYEDDRLRDLRGPIADAALIWSATPLTTVRLRGVSQLVETTIQGASGAINQAATLEIQHDLRRNLSVTGALTLGETRYKGVALKEELLTAGAKLEYKLTRSVALKASFTHERLRSTAEGSDYTANVYLLGLKFQPPL